MCVVASPGPPSSALAGRGAYAIRALPEVSGRLGNWTFSLSVPKARRVWGFLLLLCIGGIRKRLHAGMFFLCAANILGTPTSMDHLIAYVRAFFRQSGMTGGGVSRIVYRAWL